MLNFLKNTYNFYKKYGSRIIGICKLVLNLLFVIYSVLLYLELVQMVEIMQLLQARITILELELCRKTEEEKLLQAKINTKIDSNVHLIYSALFLVTPILTYFGIDTYYINKITFFTGYYLQGSSFIKSISKNLPKESKVDRESTEIQQDDI